MLLPGLLPGGRGRRGVRGCGRRRRGLAAAAAAATAASARGRREGGEGGGGGGGQLQGEAVLVQHGDEVSLWYSSKSLSGELG